MGTDASSSGSSFHQTVAGCPGSATILDPALLPDVYVVLNDLVTIIQEVQSQLALDIEDLVIFLTVVTGNLQRWHRSTHREAMQFSIDQANDLVPATQSAIARATGIARETVRRRLRGLAARSLVTLNDAGAATASLATINQILTMPQLRRLRSALGVQGPITPDVG